MVCERVRKILTEIIDIKTMTREKSLEHAEAWEHVLKCSSCFAWSMREAEKLRKEKEGEKHG